MCNATAECEVFILCPLSRNCVAKDGSHGPPSTDTDLAREGALSGEMKCYNKKPFLFDGNCLKHEFL